MVLLQGCTHESLESFATPPVYHVSKEVEDADLVGIEKSTKTWRLHVYVYVYACACEAYDA
jgi:hypothetical protein